MKGLEPDPQQDRWETTDMGHGLVDALRWIESYDRAIEKAEADAISEQGNPALHEILCEFLQRLKDGKRIALAQAGFALIEGREISDWIARRG